MFKESIKRISSVSPRAAIVGALIIEVVISGMALLLTRGGSDAKTNAEMQPHAARLERVDGSVGIARVRVEDKDNEVRWVEASVNTPVTVGDRIYARDYANASIALTGHNYVRLNPATSLDVLALDDHRTQLALRSGSAVFDVGALGSSDFYEVATPCGAVDFKQPGLYQIGMDGENVLISVLNGLAQVVGREGSGYISKGQVFTLEPAAAQALASSIAPGTAAEIVDDYYRYRYPKVYNGRYSTYDAYLAEPSYYDSYRTSASYQYLPVDIPGLYDLDSYGDWVDVSNYGYSWAPRVTAGWAPFRSGYWYLDDRWGPSWISSEPWGWAPYHYGRWTFVNQRWFWVPNGIRTVTYSPAAVAFIPMADQIVWVPLGPGEVYVPRYYDNFSPQYLGSPEVVRVVTAQNTFLNFNAPGALTAVPLRSFTRVISPSKISPVDTVVVARSRAVIDPFSVTGVRELAIRHEDGRNRIKLERREQEVLRTAVVAGTAPRGFAERGGLAGRLGVEAATENMRDRKLKITNADQVTSSRRPNGLQPLAQSQRMGELASRAERGDKSARREMRELLRKEQSTNQQPPPAPQQQAEKERSRQEVKQEHRAERQQQSTPASRQSATQQAQQQPQMKQQRKAERQQPPAPTPPAQQQQQMKQQRKEQKPKPPNAYVQPRVQQDAVRRAQTMQQEGQQKAQIHAERQQRVTQGSYGRAVAREAQAAEQFRVQRQAQQQRAAAQPNQAVVGRQAGRPSIQHPPGYLGPPVRQDAGSPSTKTDKAQRKPPQ
jgi:hypothetical protein